jgi:integrase
MGIERVSISYDGRAIRKLPYLVRWYGQSIDGTPPKRYSKSFKHKKNAEAFAAEQQHQFNHGEPRDISNVTIKELCDLFLENRRHLLRPSTLRHYHNTINQMLNFFSPHKRITDVTRPLAERFLSSRKVTHPDHLRTRQELTVWGRNGHLARAQTMFHFAHENGYIRVNPFAGIKHVKPCSHPWHFINPEKFRDILKVTPKLRVRCLYAVMYGCGLRFGEAINLLWQGQNIDFKAGRINILNRPSTSDLPGFQIKDHEIRSVPMPSWLAEMLKKLKEEANGDNPFAFLSSERFEAMKARWRQMFREGRTDDWFNRDVANNVLRDFKQHCKKAGIITAEKLTVHCLRKSYCQNLANAGIPAITMLRLTGHSSLRVCEQYYLKVADANERQAMQAMDRLMEGEQGQEGDKPTAV